MVKNTAGKYVADKKQGFKVLFDDFGDSSVDLFVVCWVLVEEKAAFVAKVKEVIYNTLNKNKIEIPFPQQDVYVRHLEMPKYRFRDYEDADPLPPVQHASSPDMESQYVPQDESVNPSAPKKRGRPKKPANKTTENKE